jgi:thioredoxin-dependent peroxiredoxin
MTPRGARVALAAAVSLAALPLGVARAQAPADRSRPTALIAGGPEVGRRAPDFSLAWANKDTVGAGEEPFGLWKTRGQTVVVAFYPRDFTPSGETMLRALATQQDSLAVHDLVIVGVSPDSLESHRKFAATLDVPFLLLSDPGQQVASRYAAKDAGGNNRRAVYVIGPDGKVAWRDLHFAPNDPKAYRELRAAVRRVARRG